MLAEANASALAIIDVQERLAGGVGPERMKAVARNAGILLKAASAIGVPVFATEQYSKGLGNTIAGLFAPDGNIAPIEKTRFSCACEEAFTSGLEASGRKQVVVAGM